MKCNKCLKIIPRGEEIRFSAHNSSYKGDGGGYGGCYCEECWKNSRYYRSYENKGKSDGNSGNSSIPSWGWFFFGMLFTLLFVSFVYWIFNKN